MNPKNTVFDAKRLIGRKFSEAAVQDDIKHFSFTVKVRSCPSHPARHPAAALLSGDDVWGWGCVMIESYLHIAGEFLDCGWQSKSR
jgi:hypothetical protein